MIMGFHCLFLFSVHIEVLCVVGGLAASFDLCLKVCLMILELPIERFE